MKILALISFCFAFSQALSADALDDALRAVRDVGREGQGNTTASVAWQTLASAPADRLPSLLEGMDGANELTVNWLRSAIETIAARERAAHRLLPIAALGQFLFDTSHNGRARRLAFEIIQEADPPTAESLLAGMLNDPAAELRRDAVARLIGQAAQATRSKEAATLLYQQALGFAREVDQVDQVSEQLRKLGQTVDLPKQFGFVMDWKVIGPFDNTKGAGFNAVFPPEKSIDLSATYDGKSNRVGWTNLVSRDDHGKIDVNLVCGKLKEVTAYCYAEFWSDHARPAELRLGSKNGWKLWLNGQFQFGRDEYHRGAEIDQYRMPVQLSAGRNKILVKLCQNEQAEDWTVEWEFQLRVCDSLGTAILTKMSRASDGSASGSE